MLRAENERGKVRKGKNQQLKWHISQISEKNLKILISAFDKLDKAKTSIDRHLLQKQSISVDKNDIFRLLNKDITNLIVEYNQTYLPREKIWDKRLVLRDSESVETNKGWQNLCVVFSLTNNKIITAYYNPPNDKHDTRNVKRDCPFGLNLRASDF